VSDPERAIIYVPVGERDRWEKLCLAYCAAHGYIVCALVEDDGTGAGWAGVTAMLMAGEADVAVVARQWHPPARRVPRVEVVELEVATDTRRPALPRQRRPRILRES
jgi:hypothetical protein